MTSLAPNTELVVPFISTLLPPVDNVVMAVLLNVPVVMLVVGSTTVDGEVQSIKCW